MQSWLAPDVPRLPAQGDPGALVVHSSDRGRLVTLDTTDVARLYVCGITPYDATHLGHAATYLAFDTLVRVWRDRGVEVEYVQNVTDIDDPLLERAARDNVDWVGLAEQQTDLFREDMVALRVVPPSHYVGAVEAMQEIAQAVARLLESGMAYRVDDDIYFPVGASEHFGQVSGLDRETMTALFAERGGDPQRPGKKDPLDALLWKAERPDDPAWDSPLGRGRPGWHVECAAIAVGRLGGAIDVQGGGSDLLFPHHEHSAVEAQALTGEWPFAQAYLHAGMVGLDGEKMSKSRGNLVFVSQLRRDGVDPGALRLALLSEHYRADRAWTPATLERAQRRLASWRAAVQRPTGPVGEPVLAAVRAALADDLDTPTALDVVDAWAAQGGDDAAAPALVGLTVDALLGVVLP